MRKKEIPRMVCCMCGRTLRVPGERLPVHTPLGKATTCPYSGVLAVTAAKPVEPIFRERMGLR